MAKPYEDESSAMRRSQDKKTVRASQRREAARIGRPEDAPEVDVACLAPEVLPGTSPEVVYNKLAPEVVESGVAIAELEGFVRDKAKYPKWMKWVTGALVFGVVTALAIGLAFEYQKESKTSTSLPAKAKTNSTTVPKPSNRSIQHVINDTSLTALISANGDRYLFFQDSEGSIRQTIHTANASRWIVDPNPVSNSDARTLTPMAASALTQPDGSQQLELYYTSINSQLNTRVLRNGSWHPGADLSLYTTSKNTRHLSIISTTNATKYGSLLPNETVNESLLLFENDLGNVTVLLRFVDSCTSDCRDPSWLDISKRNQSISRSDFLPLYYSYIDQGYDEVVSGTLYESSPGTIFGTPFASGASSQVEDPGSHFQLLICADQPLPFQKSNTPCGELFIADYTSWTNASHGFFAPNNRQNGPYQEPSFAGMKDSDLILSYNEPVPYFAPHVSFPFKRLASAVSNELTENYLYHQINETTLAEETYVVTLNYWLPSNYIIIANSS